MSPGLRVSRARNAAGLQISLRHAPAPPPLLIYFDILGVVMPAIFWLLSHGVIGTG